MSDTSSGETVVKPDNTHITDAEAGAEVKPLNTHITEVGDIQAAADDDGEATPDNTHITSDPS